MLFRLENYPNEAHHWETVQFDGQHETRLLPLHQACALNPPLNAIKALLKAYPDASLQYDVYFHRVPLHIATCRGASAEVIQSLLHATNDASEIAKQRDSLGRVPLHYAVFSHDSFDTITSLVKAYPAGIKIMDYKGWLPIHVACRYGTTLPILRTLVKAYPRSLLRRTFGGMTPLECAQRFQVLNCESMDLLRNLTLQREESARKIEPQISSTSFKCHNNFALVPPEKPLYSFLPSRGNSNAALAK